MEGDLHVQYIISLYTSLTFFSLPPPLSLSLFSLFLSGIFKSLPIDVSGVEEEDDADDDPILHESMTK